MKRIYVPLPDADTRKSLISHQILKHMKASHSNSVSNNNLVGSVNNAGANNGDASNGNNNNNTNDGNNTANVGIFQSFMSSITGSGSKQSLMPLSPAELDRVVLMSEGYSGSDLNAVSSL